LLALPLISKDATDFLIGRFRIITQRNFPAARVGFAMGVLHIFFCDFWL
jgi:hypothetical protein